MQKQVQINQLLMEREDHLVEVFELERQIGIVLGGAAAYPFALPVDLPSCRKCKKVKRKKVGTAETNTAFRLRKLDPETESAYRITYFENETEKVEIHPDPRPLALLVNTPLLHLSVLCIETVQAERENGWAVVETLFGRA
jgi:hypothetical protein